MPLLVNLRHLEKHEVRLQGQMSGAELDMESVDELIRRFLAEVRTMRGESQ